MDVTIVIFKITLSVSQHQILKEIGTWDEQKKKGNHLYGSNAKDQVKKPR